MNCTNIGYILVEWVVPKITAPSKTYQTLLDENEALMEHADVFSDISLSWMNPLIIQAAEASLSTENLPEIDRGYNTATNFAIFEKNWQNRSNDGFWALPFALFISFGSMLAKSACFEVSYNVIGFADPFLLRYLILFAATYYTDAVPAPMAIGIYIAMGMFAIAVIRTAFATKLLLYIIRCFTSLRSALMCAVYEKSLKLSAKEREGRSIGEIVNIMAVDIQTISMMVWQLTLLYDAPSQFIMCLISLHKILGTSWIMSLLVLLVFLPINYVTTNVMKRLRKQQMSFIDERTKLTTEIMSNVKSLKLYGWEKALLSRLDVVRNDKELRNLHKIILVSGVFDIVWQNIPYCAAGCCFAAFAYWNDIPLTSDIVFPCISLFNMMTGPIASIPFLLTSFIDCGVSLGRVRDFLVSEERQEDSIKKYPAATTMGETSIEIKDSTFLFDREKEDSIALGNINFTARKGELSCIVGKVGSGKTSFLRGILGDLYQSEGLISLKGSIAYVSQTPWLMNGTVKENILFGSKLDPEFYQSTIKACSLTADLDILPDGDNTEIGEKGVSLSGGQKARVSLARAVYARADLYLLDDPLSAVDEHVGRHIIKNVLSSSGLLASKTRILSTNSITVLSKADNITLLEEKGIAEVGTLGQVMSRKGHLYALIKEFGRKDRDHEDSNSSSDTEDNLLADSDTAASSTQISRKASVATLRRASVASFRKRATKSLGNDVVESDTKRTERSKELTQKGRVKWHVYTRYIKACGKLGIGFSFLIIFLAPGIELASNFWLKAWVEQNSLTHSNDNALFWIGGYFLIGFLTSLTILGRRIVTRSLCGLTASKLLHDTMARTVLRSPMSFFETTPVGRIINRFSSDINELDDGLPNAFIELLRTLVNLVVSMSVVIVSAPMVMAVLAPLSILYSYYQKYYQASSRELKRILSMSRSPIYAHFQESLSGVSTILAFDQMDRFKYQIQAHIDVNVRSIFLFRSASRWLSFRLQTIGATIVLSTALLVVVGSSQQKFSPGLIGIMMTYTLQVTDFLNNIVRAIVNLETSVVGVERVLEYCDLPSEAPEVIENKRPAAYWPSEGKIKFDNYSTRYRENLDLILKGVSVSINSREKIGIVGRTGAGKSSLVMSLFRIIEPVDGTISVDGVDITQVGLLDLRTKLSIIPQDSQIFVGTIRQNLDPFNNYSDDEIWSVLELSHLKDHIKTMPDGLNSTLSEGGSNLSAGQRQLMCLGRALLNPSNVLVLDEATASVDVQTDKIVQQTIRSEFKNKTIVTIAHRINTILDSDKIMVLDKGTVAEFDTPDNLLKNPDSLFYSLCKEGGFIGADGEKINSDGNNEGDSDGNSDENSDSTAAN